jgi:hypothetical protein
VKIISLRTEYIVRERYLNATGCLNIIFVNEILCEPTLLCVTGIR